MYSVARRREPRRIHAAGHRRSRRWRVPHQVPRDAPAEALVRGRLRPAHDRRAAHQRRGARPGRQGAGHIGGHPAADRSADRVVTDRPRRRDEGTQGPPTGRRAWRNHRRTRTSPSRLCPGPVRRDPRIVARRRRLLAEHGSVPVMPLGAEMDDSDQRELAELRAYPCWRLGTCSQSPRRASSGRSATGWFGRPGWRCSATPSIGSVSERCPFPTHLRIRQARMSPGGSQT